MISIVCPFYNEETILEKSVRLMLHNLSTLKRDWELLIVNDGSKDQSLEIAKQLEAEFPKLKVISYPTNVGRGYAIRCGVSQAKGDYVVTTEIDSSWGNDIVHKIVNEFEKKPDADIIIASPHLPAGGYRNVPLKRVLLSSIGNYVIRTGLTYKITMNTGMTRGYKREKFLRLPLDENEKEMHLEVVNKALAFGYRIYEVPAVLEWKDEKLSSIQGKKRKSSANIHKLMRTHILFSLLAAPFRYLYFVSAGMGLVGSGVFTWAIINFLRADPSIFLLLISLTLMVLSFLILGIAILAQQGRAIQRELWRVRSEVATINSCPTVYNKRMETVDVEYGDHKSRSKFV